MAEIEQAPAIVCRVPTCRGPDCERPAFARGLCEGHLKQAQRGRPLTPLRERLTHWGLVVEAAVQLADADSEDDGEYERAAERLQKAMVVWLASRRRRPPEDVQSQAQDGEP